MRWYVRYAGRFQDVDGDFDVYKSQARIYVDCEGDYDYEEAVEHLKRVFGLVGICPVVRMEDQGFDQLKKDVVAYMDEMYPDKHITFKVESRRSRKNLIRKIPWRSAVDLGEAILDAFPEIRVDVHHPDVHAQCGGSRNEIYVYSQIIPGRRRYAGRDQWEGHASAVRRDRQPGGGLYDRKERCGTVMPPISMHRRIPVNGQNRRWWIWQRSYPVMPGRSSCML